MNKNIFKKKWDSLSIEQQPQWSNIDEYNSIIENLSSYPKIVNGIKFPKSVSSQNLSV